MIIIAKKSSIIIMIKTCVGLAELAHAESLLTRCLEHCKVALCVGVGGWVCKCV